MCMYVFVCVCVCTHVYVHAHTNVNVKVRNQCQAAFSAALQLLFGDWICPEPETDRFSLVFWPVIGRFLLLCFTPWTLCADAGDLNSGPYACGTSLLLTDPPSRSPSEIRINEVGNACTLAGETIVPSVVLWDSQNLSTVQNHLGNLCT